MKNIPSKNEFIRLLGQAHTDDDIIDCDFPDDSCYCDNCDEDTYADGCSDFYDDEGIDADFPDYDEDIDIYARLVDMFDDDDLWISEWLSCQRQGRVFTYHEQSDTGYDKYTISSAEGFYDFLIELKEEKKHDAVKDRYI